MPALSDRKKSLRCPLLIALTAPAFTNSPIGRWQQKWSGDLSAMTICRTDGTFDMLLNGKLFVNRKYLHNGYGGQDHAA